MVPRELNRRVLLRMSAFAGAGALAQPLLSGLAGAAARGQSGRSGPDAAADRIVASVRRPRFPDRHFPVTVYRVTAGTVGGPLLLIQGNYSGQTGNYPPSLTGITLEDWTAGSCAGVWSIVGASAGDPVGTVVLDDITVTTSTAANSAQYVSDLVVKDVTVGGTQQTG
jgi:hypothetical protein